MNRIAEWRKRRKLSQAELAEALGTTQSTVHRLESGGQELTEDWMMRIANALNISPVDLLGVAIVAELREEVEPQPIALDGNIAAALALKGVATYRVVASALTNLNVQCGATLPIDTSEAAIANVRTGSLVIAEVKSRNGGRHLGTVLRQFVAPSLLTTNRPGRNASFSLDDEELETRILGVVMSLV
jgi:transcriptional regulator with XRE-family HTH domain